MISDKHFRALGLFWMWLLIAGLLHAQVEAPGAEQPDLEFRTWTDVTGQFHTEAALLRFVDGKVHLKKRDGRVITVSPGQLDIADQLYIRRELARRRAAQESSAGTPSPPGAAGDWPTFRGPNRDGKSPDTGLLKEWPADGPPLLWKVDNIGKGFSGVAVAGDTVYITGDVGDRLVLFALGMDGAPKWQANHGSSWTKNHPGSRATPTIDGGNLYLLSGTGLLGCFDARSGRPKWQRQMAEFGGGVPNWGYAESVLILGELAIVTPGGQNCIVALNKKTGQSVWGSQGFSAGAQYGSCIAVAHQGVPMIIAGTAEGIVGVDARNGRGLWSNPFSAHNTANCPTPAFSDGYVFWANGYGKGGICLKLDANRGQVVAREAWTTGDMVCHHGGYILHEGHIYGNHSNGYACLELESGQVKWNERGAGKGPLCFADGMLYLFGENGGQAGLATCSPEGMEMRGTFRVEGEGPSWAHPVVIGGRLYLRYDTNLYCFDVRAPGE